jgi:hypothetical protein
VIGFLWLINQIHDIVVNEGVRYILMSEVAVHERERERERAITKVLVSIMVPEHSYGELPISNNKSPYSGSNTGTTNDKSVP